MRGATLILHASSFIGSEIFILIKVEQVKQETIYKNRISLNEENQAICWKLRVSRTTRFSRERQWKCDECGQSAGKARIYKHQIIRLSMNFKVTKGKLLTSLGVGLVILLFISIIKCTGICFIEPNLENFYKGITSGLVTFVLIYLVWSLFQKK